MASSLPVLTDDSKLSWLDQKLSKLETFMVLISGLTVFALILLAVVSVGGRNFLNLPLSGYVDWIQQAMPLIAFMGISYGLRNGSHIRMDMLVGNLRGRALYLVELLTTSLILLLMLILVWGSWAHFARSFDFAAPLFSRDSSFDIGLPLWPSKLLVPISFSVLCLRATLQIFAYGRAVIHNPAAPVAVPLVRDAASQAAEEAQLVSK